MLPARDIAHAYMTQPEKLLDAVAAELGTTGRRWALVGGLAVSVRTEPRFTRDIDIAVAVEDDAQAEALVLTLQQRGLDLIASLEQEVTARLATARLALSKVQYGAVLDLLFASSGIEREVVQEAEVLEIIPGTRAPVARTGHLIALKVLSRDDSNRPQDLADLRALVSAATSKDIERARAGLRLITERGYERGRELERDLELLLRELS